jgi:hypothetical protein
MMKSIYARDYTAIRPQVPARRLKLITNLFMHMHKSTVDQNVAAEALKRIQSRMGQRSAEILDDFAVQGDALKFGPEGTGETIGSVDKNLLNIIDDSKTRSGRREKRNFGSVRTGI